MKVSIMITTYNCEKYIEQAIKSVVQQDMPFTWEVLIGDDGSSDSTQKIVLKWIEKYPNNIKLYVMPRDNDAPKNGTRAARNRANLLKKASGEYLAFLDGDDCYIGSEKIKRQVEILESKQYANVSCVAHNILANDCKENRQYPLSDKGLEEGIIDKYFYWKNLYFHTNTMLFRAHCKKLLLDNRYCDFLNDNFITYIIIQFGEIYYLKDLWAQYNLTGDGLWTGKKRTYGCFRNLIIYDLQLEINKDYAYSSLIRHLYDFRYVFNNYRVEDRQQIDQLIKDLDVSRFHYTFLMYKTNDELSDKEKKEKQRLRRKVELMQQIRRINNLRTKLIGG